MQILNHFIIHFFRNRLFLQSMSAGIFAQHDQNLSGWLRYTDAYDKL